MIISGNAWQVRLMQEDDVPAVMAIERASYPFPWTEGIFRDCLRVGYLGLVLEMEEQGLLGYVMVSVGAGEAHILNICTHPDWRREGVAQHLLDAVIMALRDKAEVLLLEVRPSNEAAQRFYLKNGFEEIGRRRNYYPASEGREDALLFSRRLD